jgi:hypothetical protein
MMRTQFEEWFIALNPDFHYMDQLNWSEHRERYFYTTTQALWEMYQRNALLEVVKTRAQTVLAYRKDVSYHTPTELNEALDNLAIDLKRAENG